MHGQVGFGASTWSSLTVGMGFLFDAGEYGSIALSDAWLASGSFSPEHPEYAWSRHIFTDPQSNFLEFGYAGGDIPIFMQLRTGLAYYEQFLNEGGGASGGNTSAAFGNTAGIETAQLFSDNGTDVSANYVVTDNFGNVYHSTVNDTTMTPEPSSFALLAAGLLSLVVARRKRLRAV